MKNINHTFLVINTFILSLTLSMFSSSIFAVSYQSHDSIYKVAKTYLKKQVDLSNNRNSVIKVAKLDSRLKLKLCSKSLSAFVPKGRRLIGKTTVGIRCEGKNPWSLHVAATISAYQMVAVASRQLQKGSVLSESDIRLKKMDVSTLPYGFIEEIKNGVGKKLRRRILKGAVLTPSMLKSPQIVNRGQEITIMALSGRMKVKVKGKALASGAVGERIKVMNLKSQHKLEGVITQSGEVKIDI